MRAALAALLAVRVPRLRTLGRWRLRIRALVSAAVVASGCGPDVGDCGPPALVIAVLGPDGARLHEFKGTLVTANPDELSAYACPSSEADLAVDCERGEIWVEFGSGTLSLAS